MYCECDEWAWAMSLIAIWSAPEWVESRFCARVYTKEWEKMLTFCYLVFVAVDLCFTIEQIARRKTRQTSWIRFVACDIQIRFSFIVSPSLSLFLFAKPNTLTDDCVCVLVRLKTLLFCICSNVCNFMERANASRICNQLKFEPKWRVKKRTREKRVRSNKKNPCKKAHMKWKTHLQKQQTQLRY